MKIAIIAILAILTMFVIPAYAEDQLSGQPEITDTAQVATAPPTTETTVIQGEQGLQGETGPQGPQGRDGTIVNGGVILDKDGKVIGLTNKAATKAIKAISTKLSIKVRVGNAKTLKRSKAYTDRKIAEEEKATDEKIGGANDYTDRQVGGVMTYIGRWTVNFKSYVGQRIANIAEKANWAIFLSLLALAVALIALIRHHPRWRPVHY
jgi:hypothetical protein